MKYLCFLTLLLVGCSGLVTGGSPKQGVRTFAYVDVSGKYSFVRETKLIKNRLVTRTQILAPQGSISKPLEKSVLVSQLGTIRDGRKRTLIIRPIAAEFSVWLDGKRYDAKQRLDVKSKAMLLDLTSPEEKWKGKSSIPFPKDKQFCFFSQIPDCLYHNNFLARAKIDAKQSLGFYVIWDAFPFIQEQLAGVGSKLFSAASLKFEGQESNVLKYQLEVDGQTVLYHFSKSYDLVRMYWVAQGITVTPPGEEQTDIEE